MSLIIPISLLIYAITIMAMLLDVKIKNMSPKVQLTFLLSIAVTLIINATAVYLLGHVLYGKLYPLLAQFPVFMCFFVIARYKGIKLLFVLLSTIVCSVPPVMCFSIFGGFSNKNMLVSLVTFFIILLLMAFLVYKILKSDVNYMLENCENRHFWLFCLIPLLHFVYVYAGTHYNFPKHIFQDGYMLRQIPTVIVLISYILLIRIFRETREKQRLENEKNIMLMQIEGAKQRLDEIKNTHEQAVIYRHDMRHHLSLLSSFAVEGNLQKIKNYLAATEAGIDAVTPVRYCDHETVNLILSAFEMQAKNQDVLLCTDVNLPKELSVNDDKICALLSNALENAITAAAQMEDNMHRKVCIRAFVNGDKLLISTENAYMGEIELDGKFPKSANKNAGHGFGFKSMAAIVEQHGGMYAFETEGGKFVLRLWLPLKKL